jgi:hypothetical protein
MKLAILLFTCSIILNTPSGPTESRHLSARQPQARPTLDTKLDKHINNFRTAGRPLLAILVDLAYEYQLPLGIEYVDREAATHAIELEFRDESLRNILLAVVGQLPEYRVAFPPGLIQVYSPQAREDTSDLLNKVIENFSVVNVDTRDADLELTCSLSRELNAGFCGGSIATGQWGPTRITAHLQNAKVYEIVNTIVAQNGKAVWTVIAPPDKLSTIPPGGLWHIYPLESAFKSIVLERLAEVGK